MNKEVIQNIIDDDSLTLCTGTIMNEDNVPVTHVWIEDGENVIDTKNNISLPNELYYSQYNVTNLKKYNKREILNLIQLKGD